MKGMISAKSKLHATIKICTADTTTAIDMSLELRLYFNIVQYAY